MNIIRLFLLLTFIVLNALTFDANAQNRRIYKGQYHKGKSQPNISLKNISKNELITLFGSLGYATYYGDLCEGVDCFKFRPQIGGGALLRTNFLGKRFSLRGDVRFFRLYSDDYYKYRNLDFRSSNWEFLALGQFDFYPYAKMMRRRPKFNPYIYGGVGLMTFDPWGKMENGKWHKLRPLETEHTKYGNVAFVYTVGFGIKFRYSYKWNFMVEGGYRYTTTDHIDDVSALNYPKASSFDNSLSAAMSNKSTNFPYNGTDAQTPQDYRGNPKNNDGYFIFSACVTYTFTKNHRPKFKGDQQLLRK
ncbi:outer membrane beta-barrel protein [Flavobacterium sp.]|uniref:outer membrane beta-barrel protein n=1 Tax=Flavobacterium sp. TaxID=239 RepID=UPI0025C45169|nr:outer membrane beta-barrel protein [Flavobacterium sp.]